MSKIGKKIITIPESVTINNDTNNNIIYVDGSLGSLKCNYSSILDVIYDIDTSFITIKPKLISKKSLSLWGLTRTLIDNMIIGVTDGFFKVVNIIGVGYEVKSHQEGLAFSLGYSNDKIIKRVDEINFDIINSNKLKVSGIDKQRVGEVVASILRLYKYNPYKQKGVVIDGIPLRVKEGKSGK